MVSTLLPPSLTLGCVFLVASCAPMDQPISTDSSPLSAEAGPRAKGESTQGTSVTGSTLGRAGSAGPPEMGPRWASRPDSLLESRAARDQIPQLEDVREIFQTMRDGPSVDTLNGGLLICDLRLPGTPWFQSRPDVRASFRIGASPPLLADGHNNRDVVTLSVPVATLKSGDRLRIEVLDRDLFSKDDYLDSAEAMFPGRFPMIMSGALRKLQATCRHFDASGVRERLGPAQERADASVSVWRSAAERGLNPAKLDFGYPWTLHEAGEDAIDGVAGLVGWGHAAVGPLRERRLAVLSVWERLVAGGVADAQAAAEDPAKPLDLDGLAVGPFQLLCGSAVKAALAGTDAAGQGAPRCALSMPITEGQVGASLAGGRSLDLVYPGGRTEALVLVASNDDSLFFRSGALPGTLGHSPLKSAVLVRVSDGFTARFVRMP